MKVVETDLPGVLLIEPIVFHDGRGHLLETWREERYRAIGVEGPFVQDNVSFSLRGVIRGLHYQDPNPQGKLVSVLGGEIFDVAVDVRPGSATYRRWTGEWLSAENARQLWVPPGFAHGFAVTSETALVHYKCTSAYASECQRTLRWDDPAIGVRWPVDDPILSEKDKRALVLQEGGGAS